MDLSKKQWSFSSIKMYEQCPYSFYLRYVEDKREQPNAFSQCGGFVHGILQRYFDGELYAFELADVFEAEYDTAVTERFPFFNMYKAYYDKSLAYLQTFDGIDGEVLGVEQELTAEIGGYRFIGYADLIMRDENGIVVYDHKSKSDWKSKKERADYLRQLYLYAYCIKQKYGEFPYKLVFNKFRAENPLDEELFNEADYTAAVEWFKQSVDRILSEAEWDCKPDSWYCDRLCGFAECPYNGRCVDENV